MPLLLCLSGVAGSEEHERLVVRVGGEGSTDGWLGGCGGYEEWDGRVQGVVGGKQLGVFRQVNQYGYIRA